MTSSVSEPNIKIRLRALEPEDLDLLYIIENDPTIWDVGIAPTYYSRYLLKQYIASSANDIHVDGQLRLVAEYDEQAIGLVDLTGYDSYSERAELGMVILPQYRGKKLSTPTLISLIEYARHLHLHQLWATVTDGNDAATAMIRKVGFRTTGHLIDWVRIGQDYKNASFWQLTL